MNQREIFNILLENILDKFKRKVVSNFSKKEYNKLIDHFRKNELNQFNMFIVQKVLTKKQFTVSNEEMITEMTAILSDRVDLTKIPTKTDKQITTLINISYEVLILLDIKEFYNKRF